jgi:hypothetical protein
MPGVVCGAIASQTVRTLIFRDVVGIEKLSRGVRAIDLETLVRAGEFPDEAEIVERRGNVEKLPIESKISLAALLDSEQVDADRMVEKQLRGMLSQDVRRLLRQQGIRDSEGVCKLWHDYLCTKESSGPACAPSDWRSAAGIRSLNRSRREDDLSLRARPQAFQHQMRFARFGQG